MITEQRVLTRKMNSKQHHETCVVIDWEGVTPEEMMQMAQWALIHEAQARFAKSTDEVPERHHISAKEIVKQRPVLLLKFAPPPPKEVVLSKAYEKLLDHMSDDDRAQLIAMLKEPA